MSVGISSPNSREAASAPSTTSMRRLSDSVTSTPVTPSRKARMNLREAASRNT
jgi:hypothetical protein